MNTQSSIYRYSLDNKQSFIDSFFEIETIKGQSSNFDLIIPDGTPGLMFIEEGAFSRWDNQIETVLKAGSAYLFGQKTRAVEYSLNGTPLKAFGAKLRPASVYTIFGISADEIKDNVIDFREVLVKGGEHSRFLAEQFTAQSFKQWAIQRNQKKHLKRSYPVLIDQLLDEIHRTKGGISIKLLADKYAKGYKYIERLFKLHIGITPKLYSRIIRFNYCITTGLLQRFPKLTDLAYQGGYFDQNHFIKETKRFTGRLPSQLFQTNKPLLEPQHLDYIKQRGY